MDCTESTVLFKVRQSYKRQKLYRYLISLISGRFHLRSINQSINLGGICCVHFKKDCHKLTTVCSLQMDETQTSVNAKFTLFSQVLSNSNRTRENPDCALSLSGTTFWVYCLNHSDAKLHESLLEFLFV